MKLPATTLTTEQKLREFDIWITPYLGDIRGTTQFKSTLAAIVRAFDRLCQATKDFASESELNHVQLADNLVKLFAGKDRAEVLTILTDLASVLFLITGKSDNNAKCQLPLFLRNTLKQETFPVQRRRTKPATKQRPAETVYRIERTAIARTVESDKYMRLVAGLDQFPTEQRNLIDTYLRFILDDDAYLAQLWSMGRSYALMKPLSRSQTLLSPLIVLLVRGSVAATGGHEPERILRKRMTEWGLVEDADFNSADVQLNSELQIAREVDRGGEKVKTRAYDFALPYRIPGWKPKVLIQSQYYAGDSGSVSHKNVDQTTAARQEAKKTVGDDVRFVEYVDGAGFFASLNGDLESLFAMPDTASFIQLKSTPIRLRREFQQIGFLTPVEIEHAIFRAGNERSAVTTLLLAEGYQQIEIDRAIGAAITHGFLAQPDANYVTIVPARREQARRYLLLDLAAVHGKPLTKEQSSEPGYILVPGYGTFHGINVAALLGAANSITSSVNAVWSDEVTFRADLDWLALQGYAIINR